MYVLCNKFAVRNWCIEQFMWLILTNKGFLFLLRLYGHNTLLWFKILVILVNLIKLLGLFVCIHIKLPGMQLKLNITYIKNRIQNSSFFLKQRIYMNFDKN